MTSRRWGPSSTACPPSWPVAWTSSRRSANGSGNRFGGSARRLPRTSTAPPRPALLELALKTALDAVQADRGRLSVRSTADEPLAEAARVGSLAGAEELVHEAERAALKSGALGEAEAEISMLSVTLGAPGERGARADHGGPLRPAVHRRRS